MGLQLSESKTKITNLNYSKVLFLGTIIKRARHENFVRLKGNNLRRRTSRKLRFEAPIPRVLSKLTAAGFMKNGKSYPKFV